MLPGAAWCCLQWCVNGRSIYSQSLQQLTDTMNNDTRLQHPPWRASQPARQQYCYFVADAEEKTPSRSRAWSRFEKQPPQSKPFSCSRTKIHSEDDAMPLSLPLVTQPSQTSQRKWLLARVPCSDTCLMRSVTMQSRASLRLPPMEHQDHVEWSVSLLNEAVHSFTGLVRLDENAHTIITQYAAPLCTQHSIELPREKTVELITLCCRCMVRRAPMIPYMWRTITVARDISQCKLPRKEIEEGLARCTDSRDAHFSKFQLVFNN